VKPKRISDLIQALNQLAPTETAADWDNVGLLVGDPSWETPGAIVSIDLTAQAIEAAKEKGFRLIVNHHPCIFPKSRGLSRVTAGHLVFEALRNGIAVFASHTNFDQCALEVVEQVSQGLGVVPRGRLVDHPGESLLKLSVFVPSTHLEQVRKAVCDAGAGHVGNYDSCTFATPGIGTFRGSEDARPYLGKPGQLEQAEEHRLETVFPRGLKRQVLTALQDSHPYEEIAYDLYAVEQAPPAKGLVKGLGYGFWGEFKEPKSFSEVAEGVKKLFAVEGFWVTEPSLAPENEKIRRIGYVAGKGASFVGSAASLGCDLFITGEAGYHTALDGVRRGMAVMELGHRESELFFLRTMEGWLTRLGISAVTQNLPTQKIWTGP